MEYVKRSQASHETEDSRVREVVAKMIERIRTLGEPAAEEYARTLDDWQGNFVLTQDKKAALIAEVSDQDKEDIGFAHTQVKRFAEAQRTSLTEFEIETEPGVRLGQRIVPVDCAGCYVPGGRYAHAASAIMSIATAKVAGVPFVVAASPPRNGSISPQVVYAMDLAGADIILEMGGVQAVASMAFGLFGTRPADILVGPGNSYVAEAKRLLFGEVGIDVIAGPTESAIIADESADAMTVAIDLAAQAEHGPDSPVWLFTTSRQLAGDVARIMPKIAAGMPSGDVVMAAWQEINAEANLTFSAVASRISRLEGMDGHARACDWRLKKYFPDQDWSFEVSDQQRYD